MPRIPWKYKQPVEVPRQFKPLLWDHPEETAPLEKLIVRVFQYGSFEELRWLFTNYPQESFDTVERYADIKRGVKFWIRNWYEREND